MLGTYVPSLIRTAAPYLVAWLLSLKFTGPILDALGQEHASEADKQRLVGLAVLVLGTLYYAAARPLERRYPLLSVLLGSTKQPALYTDTGGYTGRHALVDNPPTDPNPYMGGGSTQGGKP